MKRVSRLIKNSISAVEKLFLARPRACDGHLTEELRRNVALLPLPDGKGSEDVEEKWAVNLRKLRNEILTGDLRKFLCWPVIRSTMSVGNARFLEGEWRYIRKHRRWNQEIKTAIAENRTGSPRCYYRYPRSSGTLVHHAYTLFRFLDTAQADLADFGVIIEFGGGYGSLCRLAAQLGFRGLYVIFDVPILAALQTYYLKSIGLPVSSCRGVPAGQEGLRCSTVSQMSELEALVGTLSQSTGSLFVAMWSLSETPIRLRERIRGLANAFSAHLISFQNRFAETDNLEFFESWQASMPGMEWSRIPIEHLGQHYYLFGRRRISG